jgi:hypothetical protein
MSRSLCPTPEQLWVARLLDACSSGRNGWIAKTQVCLRSPAYSSNRGVTQIVANPRGPSASEGRVSVGPATKFRPHELLRNTKLPA